MHLATERLLLTPISTSHTTALEEVYGDPNVARYVGGDRLTPEMVRLQVEDFAREWEVRGYGQSAVLAREDQRFLGRVGLHYWPAWQEVELGYVLAARAQGRGLATEACRAWIEWSAQSDAVPYLIANIHPENSASIQLASKLGFRFDRHDETPSGLPTEIYRLDF
jgi:RimJ/RimL family protein N-acetyltransferase